MEHHHTVTDTVVAGAYQVLMEQLQLSASLFSRTCI